MSFLPPHVSVNLNIPAAAMVNWDASATISLDSDVYGKLVFSLFGLYVWELFQTSDFEWSIITKTRKFTWPLVIFFFLCRYCLLLSLIGLIISLTIRDPIDCQALYTFNSWAGNMAILCASTSLMIRTIAIWERKLKIVIPLCLLALGHWAVLWRGMFVLEAQYDPTQDSCALVKSNHIFLDVSFFVTMGFDLTILLFTITALLPHKTKSGLWAILFKDGLVYFIIAFCFNAMPAILNVLDLNVSMNVIATVPAATFSAIAACRSVIRLQEFRHHDVYVHSASQVLPSTPLTNGPPRRFTSGRAQRSFGVTRPEVHVTTDQIVMDDFGASPVSGGSGSTKVDLKRTDSLGTSVLEMEDKDADSVCSESKGAYDVATAV